MQEGTERHGKWVQAESGAAQSGQAARSVPRRNARGPDRKAARRTAEAARASTAKRAAAKYDTSRVNGIVKARGRAAKAPA